MVQTRTIHAFGKYIPSDSLRSVSNFLYGLILAFLLAPQAATAQQIDIQKCQDTHGNWYYGNSISTACVSSIAVLNQNGVQIRQRAPFQAVSAQQLAALQRQKAADLQILRRYSSVQSIKQERARKLNELTRQRQINVEIIDRMDQDAQQLISQNEPDIENALAERQAAVVKYRGRQNELNNKIQNLDARYERITRDYLEALSRKDP